MNLGRIDPEWVGYTAVCIASGPSLTLADVNRIRDWRQRDGCRVVVINDNYLIAPWADACYFADVRWWEHHRAKPFFRDFAGRKISIENGAGRFAADATVLRNLSLQGGTMGRLSLDPTGIYTGQNSGYQAIGVAVLYGCRRIVLLGYDMRAKEMPQDEPGRGGVKLSHHWFGDHPWPSDGGSYRYFREEFGRMAPTARMNGIEILNATPDSALEHFPMVTLDEVMACAPTA